MRRKGSSSLGFTLVELLLVMGTVGVILGAGLGMLASLNPGERTAVGIVQSTLRAANNSAIARSGPARVRFDFDANSLSAEALAVVGTWRFEDPSLRGAFGLGGTAFGVDAAPIGERGFQGRCLDLAQAPKGARMEFAVHEDPAFDPRAGFRIEAAVRLSGLAATTLLDLGGVFLLEVGPSAELAATFAAEAIAETGEPIRGARITLRTGPGALRVGYWSRLQVTYDRRFLTIAVDGVELARRPETTRVWRLERGMILGGGRSPFPGALDELVISVVAESRVLELAGGVHFGADAPSEIVFAAGGGLDPLVHAGPVTVPLQFGDGRQETVRIGRYGTVE